MRIGIHQPNFIPWLPYFYKMAMCDKFIILGNVQFEKNGYQNRYKLSSGKWVTKPVVGGVDKICNKEYVGGGSLYDHNLSWIRCIKDTLNIKTEIIDDYIHNQNGLGFETPTHRLISLIKWFNGTHYITNEDAKYKYLDEDLMREHGIEIEYCKVPKQLQVHTFEAFEKWGIECVINQLPKSLICENAEIVVAKN